MLNGGMSVGQIKGLPEEEVKKWVDHIALICLSDEFQQLKEELETLYFDSSLSDSQITAFSDALYAVIAEKLKLD